MTEAAPKRSPPRRDWIVLPLLSLFTVLVMVCMAEGIARVVWPETGVDACIMASDGEKPKANCSGFSKAAEGPWVETRYNDCGYRATGPCRLPPAAGTERMAVLGSSTGFGFMVGFDHVWSVQAARAITAKCGRPVDVQSIVEVSKTGSHLGFGSLNDMARRLPEAIALHPTLVALLITPFDLADMPAGGFNPQQKPQTELELRRIGLMERVRYLVSESRIMMVAQHFLYRDTKTYVWTYLHYGDRAAFLRPPMSPAWQERLAYVDAAVGYIAGQLKPTGTPLLLALAPTEAQAYIIADKMEIPGVDAGAFGRAIAAIAERHGAIFADGAAAFQGVHDPQDDFYRVDGHFNAEGHELLGSVVAKAVLSAQPAGYCDKEASR